LGLADDIVATIAAFYAAAAGQTDWHRALDQLLRTMDYTHATVYANDRHVRAAATDDFRLPVTGFWHGHDPAWQRDYEQEYFKHELGRHYFLRNPGTRIRHDLMFTTEAEMDRSAFYAWAEGKGDLRYIVVGQTDPALPIGAALSLQRSRRGGATTVAEVERLRLLLDHFERAVQLEYYLGKALAPNVASLDFVDRNPTGIVLLDAFGRVVLANRAARVMAARDDSFRLEADGMAALRSRDDTALRRLIGGALRTSAGAGLASGGAVRLPRRNSRLPYIAVVTPLARRESILSSLMPAASVLIADPEAEPQRATAVLRSLYGLVPSEARLAERLMAGDSLEAAAQSLGITIATARSYLAAIFRKTETNRQSELVRLLLSPPWWALNDGDTP
jgi:DNA-binding CsgD family transcriptional regulator